MAAPVSCVACRELPEEGILSRHLFFSPAVDLAEAIDLFRAGAPDLDDDGGIINVDDDASLDDVFGSLVNHDKFKETQKQLGLQPSELVQLSKTRWSCQLMSINAMIENFPAVLTCLSNISNPTAGVQACNPGSSTFLKEEDLRGLADHYNVDLKREEGDKPIRQSLDGLTRWAQLHLEFMGFPRKKYGTDCGIFMLMHVLYKVMDAPFDFTVIDMPALRKWWCIMLIENLDLGSHGKLFAHWTDASKALLRGEVQ
ncbi:unnamed protein product [Gadus morhua 'NCC']